MGIISYPAGGGPAHNLLSPTHPDTLTASVVAGDLVYGDATPLWDRLPVGTNGQVLGVAVGFPKWINQPASTIQSYFLTNTASDIGGIYKTMEIGLPAGGDAFVSASITGAGIAIGNWATLIGFPSTTFIPLGTWKVHLHVARTAGGGSTELYCGIYKRTQPGGIETLLGTAGPITINADPLVEIDLDVAIADTILLVSDRLVIKVYGDKVVGSGSNPTIAVHYQGSTASRLDLPVSTSSLDHGTLLGLGDDDHLQYALLAGRASGQILQGGIAASETLTLQGTAHATPGLVKINPAGGNTQNYGTVGLWGTAPIDTVGLFSIKSHTDPGANTSLVYTQQFPSYTSGGVVSKQFQAMAFFVRPIINTGQRNSGYMAGVFGQVTRNQNAAGSDDGGIGDLLYGIRADYGHFNTNAAATPRTLNAYGIYISSIQRTGQIDTAYDLYLAARDGTAALTHYGIYQAGANCLNYLAGNTGIGQLTFGTNAAQVLAIGSGTAPTTSPADAIQMWSADRNATAGKASLHLRVETGVVHCFGDLVGINSVTPAAMLSLNGGAHVGGDTDPGDNNLLVDGTGTITGGFGCNTKAAQTAYASGGALAAYSTGIFGLDSDAHMSALHAMVVSIRAALVANGIMS